MPKIVKNHLVNRASGLYSQGKPEKAKKPKEIKAGSKKQTGGTEKNKIAPGLKQLVRSIEGLKFDPENARKHPERNMEAIKQSLATYGQVKPIVVRESNSVVVAGNGTLQGAIDLGWTEIAALTVDMSDIEAAGFGLADNRTAELAKWEFEVVAKLDKLLQEANHPSIGWSADELEVLREADWTPPPISDDERKEGSTSVSFTTDSEKETLSKALEKAKEVWGPLKSGPLVTRVLLEWLDSRE